MKRFLGVIVLGVLGLEGCTRPAKGVCCTSTSDCASIGASDDMMRTCPSDQVCSEHQCVAPLCSTSMDCSMAGAPVCDEGLCVACDTEHACPDGVCKLDDGTCVECNETMDCAAGVCDEAQNTCVECLMSMDCGASKPVCDSQTCRTCKLDSECPSEACADDGTCVPADGVAYVSPSGGDSGTCTAMAPCGTFNYTFGKMSSTRTHLVVATGTYPAGVVATSIMTQAPSITIHGNGATIGAATGIGETLRNDNGIVLIVRDLTILKGQDQTIGAHSSMTLERVVVNGNVDAFAQLSMRNVQVIISDGRFAVSLNTGSTLSIQQGVISGGGIRSVATTDPRPSFNASNMIIHSTPQLALKLQGVTGTVRSSTIAYSGDAAGTGVYAIDCGAVGFDSSIIWAPGSSTARPPLDPLCRVTNSIVGPTKVGSSPNSDPLFVNPTTKDFHIKATSPAVDGVATGPSLDFEGDTRPKGASFDLGADEAN